MTRAFCIFCREELPVEPPDKNHWKICPSHPARMEIDHLLNGLRSAVKWFRHQDPTDDPLWKDAADQLEQFYIQVHHDGTARR
jgi:hypothetical protein